jgi:Acyl-CoA reductase (LuxC).
MNLNFELIRFCIGSQETVEQMCTVPCLSPFHDQVINYFDSVSKLLLGNKEAKNYPDVVTFGFWCRKASLLKLRDSYQDVGKWLGRGTIFHVAPSNVPVNFAYTLAVGLLSGNSNIVRLPSKEFKQVRLICNALLEALNEKIQPYLCLIQYEHNSEITDYLSLLCDTRIIWGGNKTIAEIRRSPLKPRATEITFADRYSICMIESGNYLRRKEWKQVASGFYNDTYLMDQNACTSPVAVVWLGDYSAEAQEIFWKELYEIVKEKYELQPVKAVEKYSKLCKQAMETADVCYHRGADNLIIRVEMGENKINLAESKGNCGYFMEYKVKDLQNMDFLFRSECQTVSYYGLSADEIVQSILKSGCRGADRIVPIGRTQDFMLVWDGYDLIRSLSREISI